MRSVDFVRSEQPCAYLHRQFVSTILFFFCHIIASVVEITTQGRYTGEGQNNINEQLITKYLGGISATSTSTNRDLSTAGLHTNNCTYVVGKPQSVISRSHVFSSMLWNRLRVVVLRNSKLP